jgi:heavy metal sensor kinase
MLVLPFALVGAGFAGYRIAGKALVPISTMAALTEQITASQLSRRVPVENPQDEFGRMAGVLNGMLQRLEESFQKLQRFTSDVSHELHTPLASIRSVGEVGLQQEHSAEEYQDIIGSMLEEVARLTSMTDTLLTINQAECGSIRLNRAIFPIMDVIEESVAVVGVLAEDKRQRIVIGGEDGLLVSADRSLLRMAVINLLDNAVKYSPPSTEIRVRLDLFQGESPHSPQLNLAIQDEGPGIPPAEAKRVFDRFYRLDESRARDTGGAGLGLAIAKWSIEAHGGNILLESSLGHGAAFSIRLPLA